MARLETLCVYCGSRCGGAVGDPAALATALGRRCARAGVRVVFGGGHVGLMGRLADATMTAGGEVVGVIPEHLVRQEVAATNITALEVVPSMHDRKRRMAELADAFCVLPGGLGTLDETIEILTWKHLGLHDKPVLLLDPDDYWRPFKDLLAYQARAGFLDPGYESLFTVVPDVESLFQAVASHPAPQTPLPADRL